MGWVFTHSPTHGSDRLVLLSLANHAGPSPVGTDAAFESYPGIALIQREAGLERQRTVQDALHRLEADGHIERVINGAPDERIRRDRRPNLYRILTANGVTCGDTRCSCNGETDGVTPLGVHGVTRGAERGDGSRRDGVTDRDATGCRFASPEPSVEPSVEPSLEPRGANELFAAPSTSRDTPRRQSRRQAKKRHAVPENFVADPGMLAWAREKGFSNAQTVSETERFVNYWQSRGEIRADWVAAWRNWMLKAVTDLPAPGAALAGPDAGVSYR